MRIVVDTNVLISGVFWTGTPCKVLEAWASSAFDMYASAEIMEEYFEVLDRLSTKLGRGGFGRALEDVSLRTYRVSGV